MTTTLSSKPDKVGQARTRGSVPAGMALILAGAIQADGGIVSAAYRSDSPVPDDLLSYPWHHASAFATTGTWLFTQVMITMALVVFARSEATGSSRSGRVGAWLSVGGGTLYVLAHLVTLTFIDARIDDAAGTVVMVLFGLGTLLGAVGFILAGVATSRAGSWSGWHRFTPLVVGITTVVLIPLQFTPLLPVTVALYSCTVVALGIAMVAESYAPSVAQGA